jgi:hypothetical protein
MYVSTPGSVNWWRGDFVTAVGQEVELLACVYIIDCLLIKDESDATGQGNQCLLRCCRPVAKVAADRNDAYLF